VPESDVQEYPHRVRVWFGGHAVEEHVALPDPAASYEAPTRRRFASLLVTNEPVATTPGSTIGVS
jgi:hypothetical protein